MKKLFLNIYTIPLINYLSKEINKFIILSNKIFKFYHKNKHLTNQININEINNF